MFGPLISLLLANPSLGFILFSGLVALLIYIIASVSKSEGFLSVNLDKYAVTKREMEEAPSPDDDDFEEEASHVEHEPTKVSDLHLYCDQSGSCINHDKEKRYENIKEGLIFYNHK